MGFIESYKRLDNLCKDLLNSEKGVTSYIESMENTGSRYIQIENWESDYRNLKKYRYTRNQIVHENYANEKNMCNENDTHWLEQFHQRILNRTDPLALYYKKPALTPKKQIFSTQPVAKKTKVWKKLLITSLALILFIGIIIIMYKYFA